MVFSEPTFLFFFLPLTTACYFLLPGKVRNFFLLGVSLIFYAWSEKIFLLVMLALIVLNYFFAIWIDRAPQQKQRLLLTQLGVAANLLVLGYFKYVHFFVSSVTDDEAIIAYTRSIHLPIGISFYVFQAVSYLIDVYRRDVVAQRDPIKMALFKSLFPQLIAGPIVRYSEIATDLAERKTTKSDFAAGMERFVIGLAKKILIADPLGLVADQIFAVPLEGLSTPVAWLGVICYTFQIFFDFSAYSDMAIGLGRIFGFKFPENFNYPYIATSVTEFWRRWHMTLSRWFRDYVYIPLGGNRCGKLRTYGNLFLVFLLCGLWHGASWNFILWGAYYGAFLVLERLGLQALLARVPRLFTHAYLLLIVIVGWVPFRAETTDQAWTFLKFMFSSGTGDAALMFPMERFIDSYVVFTLALALIFSMPVGSWLRHRLTASNHFTLGRFGYTGFVASIFLLSVAAAGAASYSPFIYFRF